MDKNGKYTKHTRNILRRMHLIKNGECWNLHRTVWCEGGMKPSNVWQLIRNTWRRILTPLSRYMATSRELTTRCSFPLTEIHRSSPNKSCKKYITPLWRLANTWVPVRSGNTTTQPTIRGTFQDLLHVGIPQKLWENQARLKQVGVPQCTLCGGYPHGAGQSIHVVHGGLGHCTEIDNG